MMDLIAELAKLIKDKKTFDAVNALLARAFLAGMVAERQKDEDDAADALKSYEGK